MLPTLNDVDVNPKKPSKPADLKMSSEVILRSPEGAGCGALRSLSRGPQSDTIPEGAGRGAVSGFGSAACQELRSGLSVPSGSLIHPIIPNECRGLRHTLRNRVIYAFTTEVCKRVRKYTPNNFVKPKRCQFS